MIKFPTSYLMGNHLRTILFLSHLYSKWLHLRTELFIPRTISKRQTFTSILSIYSFSEFSNLFSAFYFSKLFIAGTFSATILKRALITSNAIYRYFRLIIIPFLALKFAFYNSIWVLFDVFGVNF